MSPRPRFEDEQFSLLPVSRSEPLRIPAHAPNSPTSREAAIRIAPRTNALRDQVYDAIVAAGEAGATRKDLEAVTGIITQTITARIVELKREGLIQPLTYFDIKARAVATVRRENCEVLIVSRGAA
jgi:hypothetical protein